MTGDIAEAANNHGENEEVLFDHVDEKLSNKMLSCCSNI